MAMRTAPHGDAQLEMFSALFTDIASRDAREAMEVPLLSLTKQPRFDPIRYKKDDIEVVVTGGKPFGIANIWDWDLVIWLMSQVRQALDRGEKPSRKIRFHRRAFLKDARRSDGGDQYRRLHESIQRLSNTNVFTTIRPGPGRRTVKFTWIEFADIERDESGRMTYAVVVIPEWLYAAACDQSRVLTLHRDYFLLKGGLERWLYRLARKGAGSRRWSWTIEGLHHRSGSTSKLKYFARAIRRIVAQGDLLDYRLWIENRRGRAVLCAECTRARAPRPAPKKPSYVCERSKPVLALKPSTREAAQFAFPGYDVDCLEQEWREATASNGIVLRDPDRAFQSWCRTVVSRRSPTVKRRPVGNRG